MGGLLAPSNVISGSVLAPTPALASSPYSGLYQTLNGYAFGVSGTQYSGLDASQFSFGGLPSPSRALTAIAGSPLTVPARVSDFSAASNGLMMTCRSGAISDAVYVYLIDQITGNLTAAPGMPLSPAGAGHVAATAFSPDSSTLFVTGAGVVYAYPINHLTGAVGAPVSINIAEPINIIISGTVGNNVYIFAFTGFVGAQRVYVIKWSSGVLSVVGSYATLDHAGGFKLSTNKNYLFISTSYGISTFSVNPTTGALAFSSQITLPNSWTCSTALEVTADYVFVGTAGLAKLLVYAISANGSLTYVSTTDVLANYYQCIQASADGSLLFETDQVHLNVYSISQGVLTIAETSVNVSTSTAVVLVPGTEFIYVANNTSATIHGFTNNLVPGYKLVTAEFDPTGQLGGVVNINGILRVNEVLIGGKLPATFPAITGNYGKFLLLDTTGNTAWTPLNKYIPITMVANAGAFTVDMNSEYIVEFTGVLTAQGTVTYTATITQLPTTVVFNNMTTGNFPLILNAGGFTIPAGISQWYWDGATLKQMFVAVTGITTIATAATPDIFNAAGATISYDNTTPVTTTGFVACTLAQVGIPKKLIPVQNANFTASANLIIDGATSGTIVMPAGANIEVLPLTTTQFKVTTLSAYASGSAAVTAASGAFTTVVGSYTMVKVGRQITYRVKVAITTNGTAAGAVLVALPIANGADLRAVGTGQETAVTGASLLSIMVANSATMQITIESSGLYPGGNGYTLECQITMFV